MLQGALPSRCRFNEHVGDMIGLEILELRDTLICEDVCIRDTLVCPLSAEHDVRRQLKRPRVFLKRLILAISSKVHSSEGDDWKFKDGRRSGSMYYYCFSKCD